MLQYSMTRLTLLLRLRQGMQAEETAFRLAGFGGAMLASPSLEPCSSFGRIVLGGITGQWYKMVEERNRLET